MHLIVKASYWMHFLLRYLPNLIHHFLPSLITKKGTE